MHRAAGPGRAAASRAHRPVLGPGRGSPARAAPGRAPGSSGFRRAYNLYYALGPFRASRLFQAGRAGHYFIITGQAYLMRLPGQQ